LVGVGFLKQNVKSVTSDPRNGGDAFSRLFVAASKAQQLCCCGFEAAWNKPRETDVVPIKSKGPPLDELSGEGRECVERSGRNRCQRQCERQESSGFRTASPQCELRC